jgi:VanZ family protein
MTSPTGDDGQTPGQRGEMVLWVLIAAFIVYGSLHPFEFHGLAHPAATFPHLMTTWRNWDHPSDLLSNVLLYMPFGWFGCAALPPRLAWPVRAVLASAGGVLLSATMELLQFYDAGRDSTLGDVYANTIGTALGVFAAVSVRFGQRWDLLRALGTDKPGTAVLLAWFAYRLYPYVPTADWHKLARAVVAVVRDPAPDVGDCVRFGVSWLLIATITDALYPPRQARIIFPLLVGCEFLGRIMIVDATLSLKDLAGAAAAWLVWSLAPAWRTDHRHGGLAAVMTLLVLAERLTPFRFAAEPLRPFGWVPALSLMQGSINVAMQAFCEKAFTYGGLIWLWWRSGLGLGSATAGIAVMLGLTSYAETWLPNRSAEVTDAMLALMIGMGFALLTIRSPLRDNAEDRCRLESR